MLYFLSMPCLMQNDETNGAVRIYTPKNGIPLDDLSLELRVRLGGWCERIVA